MSGRGGAFTFIDLFAGIGGMRMACEAVGGRCVFTSEWNRFAVETYRANFPCDHPVAGDIREVRSEEEIPPHDVLVAGFPCQPFSIAGVSKKNALGRPHGFRDATHGTLFFEVARIIEHHRPAAFLLENVKNLLTHDRGRTFHVILRVLEEELGYHVDWAVLDGKGFVPQHRERTYIVGFREETDFRFSHHEPPGSPEADENAHSLSNPIYFRSSDLNLPNPANGPKLSSVLHPEDGSEEPEAPFTEGPKGKVAAKYTLTEHLWQYLQAYAAKHKEQGNGFGFGLVGPDDVARTLSARYYKDGSEILIRQGRGCPRRLTPRECARLMGFDRPGQTPFVIPVSDTQAYKQFGNSVVVPAVELVAAAIALDLPSGNSERGRRRKNKPGQLLLFHRDDRPFPVAVG